MCGELKQFTRFAVDDFSNPIQTHTERLTLERLMFPATVQQGHGLASSCLCSTAFSKQPPAPGLLPMQRGNQSLTDVGQSAEWTLTSFRCFPADFPEM
uniref:uncharacterized protein si:ch211-198p11.6 isoform X2 n=1 Tax=Doryrhamphus excisus TaxID=161450 RepID=UPI0025AE239E|nr:uncharacterized protein si:ch211-198p11.6 isoform X2 [Doryrhamphus excisus]